MTEQDTNYHPDDTNIAYGLACQLEYITKREAKFRQVIMGRQAKGKFDTPEIILKKHELLVMSQKSLVTELCAMGYNDLCLSALEG